MIGPGLAPGAASPITALALAALLLIAAAILMGRWPVWVLGALVSALAVGAAFLYRDPPRPTGQNAALIMAPADGRVVAVDSVDGSPYLAGPARRILIRTGLLDVHVLRSPVDGVVDYARRSTGRVRVGISTGRMRVLLRHEPVGRPLVREGQRVRRGQRTGVLPLGGRIELLLPPDLRLRTAVGDRVRSGATAVAAVVEGAP